MNYKFAICSGAQVRVFVASNDMANIQANVLAGEQLVETPISGSPADYMYVNGAVVPLPPKPNQYCVFDYDTLQWVDQRTPEMQWDIVRADRNQRLQACDWTQLSDIPTETKTLWEPYRQELRDVTDQPDPFNIVWPTPPQ